MGDGEARKNGDQGWTLQPFEEPQRHWYIAEGQDAELRDGRRRGVVFPPRNQRIEWVLGDDTLARSREYSSGYDLMLVNRIREQVKAWREAGYPGATRTSLELLEWWQRDGRQRPLFFSQREAAETIIFLNEARADFRQGIAVPREEVGPDREAEGYNAFEGYACKMATGWGKTTVMGMIAAWSILNRRKSLVRSASRPKGSIFIAVLRLDGGTVVGRDSTRHGPR